MKAQAAAEEEAKKAAKERWTVERTIVESSSIIMVFKTFRGTYLFRSSWMIQSSRVIMIKVGLQYQNHLRIKHATLTNTLTNLANARI